MSENISTVGNSSGSPDYSFAAIRKAMDDFEELHPAKDRPVRIRCGPQMLFHLKSLPEFKSAPFNPESFGSYGFLPIERDDKLPYPEYCVEMADGWEIHNVAGVNIRRKTER